MIFFRILFIGDIHRWFWFGHQTSEILDIEGKLMLQNFSDVIELCEVMGDLFFFYSDAHESLATFIDSSVVVVA